MQKRYDPAEMPWDCDKYFEFDPDWDRAVWPVSPVRHGPIALAVATLIAAFGVWVLFG